MTKMLFKFKQFILVYITIKKKNKYNYTYIIGLQGCGVRK